MSRAVAVRITFVLGLLALPLILWGDDPPSSKQRAGEKAAIKSSPKPAAGVVAEVVRPAASPEEKIRLVLKTPTDVDWVETPLEECVQFLAKAKHINILLDRTTIADEGVQLDTPVTLRLAGATLQSVLNLLLGPSQLTTVFRDGVLMVTTSVRAGETFVTRIHPVKRQLMGRDSHALLEVIASTIEPETWDAVGGPGCIRPIPGGFVIRQTHGVHPHVAALLLELDGVISAPKAAGIVRPREHSVHPSEAEIRKILDEPATFDWNETPLEEVLQAISERHKLKMWLDRTTISDEGVQLDTPISLHLANHRLSSVLHLILAPSQLEWLIEDEVLKITTIVRAGDKLATVVYDVRDLLELMPADTIPALRGGIGGGIGGGVGYFDVQPQFAAGRMLAQGFGGGGMGGLGGGAFQPADLNPVEGLIDSITSTIEPETWEAVGGPGSIREHLGALIVRQTRVVHDEIEKLFADMRRVAAADQANQPAKKPADPNALVLRVYQMPHYPSEDLAKSLPDLVAAETWDKSGGKGTVRAVKGALLVWQTKAVHQQVIDLLNQLPIWSYTPQAPATKTDPPAKTDPAAKPNDPATAARAGGGYFMIR